MPSEQENFFTLLDLLPPKHGGKQTDLDPYFGIKAYTKAAFDPYAAPETQEKLLECSELPLFDYQPEKIWGLCRTLKADWKLLWRPHQHYELGNCLIFESQSRKHKLGTYHLLSNYINAVEAVVLSLFVLTNLISWYKNYMTSTGYVYLAAYLGKAEDTNGYWHTTSIFLGPGTLIMSIIVLAWALTRNERTPCGLLRYLRQIGKPLVEEVMFSYSWQPGIQNDIRCLARGILKNEIGVWIDVLKLISGDKASRVTRTVAAHARFVVVCLTAAYVNSPACFIELYEALNAPVSAKDRVIVFWPDEAKMGLSYKEEDMKRVTTLAGQLEKKGITVIREYSRLIDYLNHRVIYSVDLSHYIWWLKHVGSGFGVPDKAILPTVSKLKRFNLFGKFAPKNAVTISNLWLSSDMRKTTEKGYAFPFFFVIYILTIFLTIFGYAIFDTSSLAWISFPIASAVLLYTGQVDFLYLVDCRQNQSKCLKPLLAANGFDKSINPPTRYVGSFRKWWKARRHVPKMTESSHVFNVMPKFSTTAKSTNLPIEDSQLPSRAVSTIDILPRFNSAKIVPTSNTNFDNNANGIGRVSVAVHDFDTNHPIAQNLRQFLINLGIRFPKDERDYEDNLVMVHVFVFGGQKDTDSPSSSIASQVEEFKKKLVQYSLSVSDCVLVVCHPKDNTTKVDIFGQELEKGVLMGSYILLLAWELDENFAKDTILQIGLRVKNALKIYGYKLQKNKPELF